MSVTTEAQGASAQPTDTAGKPAASYVPLVGRITAEESIEERVPPLPRQLEVRRTERVDGDGRAAGDGGAVRRPGGVRCGGPRPDQASDCRGREGSSSDR